MNNESIKSTTISSASLSTNSTSTTPSSSSIPSLLPATSSSLSSSSSQSSHSHLPVTPPNDAAVVVAVAIIPDTPIVSIAGSTLSEITTTTTSTRTTPTPVPTSRETTTTNKNHNNNKKNILNTSSDSLPIQSSASASSSNASIKGSNPMSVANSSVQVGAISNATTASPAAKTAAADNDVNSRQTQSNSNTTTTPKGSSASESSLSKQQDSTLSSSTAPAETSSPSQTVGNATAVSKTDENILSNEQQKSKDFLSESWEESRLKDWDDSKLKELLDEAYSYKNPRDKENKSKTFLKLLEKAENEDQSYPFRAITSRGSRNLSSSITSNSCHHYPNSHYHSHSHNHNRSHHHHHHKQGGSLQDLFEIGLHETQLDCDQTFGSGFGGNQRTRRQNHNSRQKKYSSSVSSRQREGGSLPSNVNATHQLTGVGVGHDLGFMPKESTPSTSISAPGKASKKEQRRNAGKAVAVVGSPPENKESGGTTFTTGGESPTSAAVPVENTSTATNTTSSFTAGGGDFIIDMGESMMDIQQQQKILQSKGQDSTKQGQSFYERLASIDRRIPRVNLIDPTKGSYFAPTTSHCYVDETIRFNTLERNGTTHSSPNTTMDAKFLPLDENYKSCKSVLGADADKPSEILGKPKLNAIYTKISSPASGSSVLGGTTNNITPILQRPLDENGNALSELYPNSCSVGLAAGTGATMQINCISPTAASPGSAGILLTSCGTSVSTSATVTIPPHPTSTTVSTSATITTYASGPSQAKAKAKKKSQQERNTKTVDVESVAGYRGKDPVEELVRYIESSGEGGGGGGGGGGPTKTADKKKERKKDKDKHQKLKKSNSLEELRSGAKMEVHELKRTAATTESNAVLLRQKSGTTTGKQNKNNSSSTADINKNLEGKNPNTNNRKTDRRSWGNEDLKYLADQQNANDDILTNDDKTVAAVVTTTPPTLTSAGTKERRNNKGSLAAAAIKGHDEKDMKDKTAERNERNLTNNLTNHHISSNAPQIESKVDKPERTEKVERRKRYDTPPNAVTIIDIVPMESSCPETAEFHVVTKKKKPKKPKVISNSEETSVTFNRTHNFTIQKSSTLNQQHQSIPRYKYYQHDGNNSGSGGTQSHQQQYNSNSMGVVANSSNSAAQQQQYQQSTETYNNADNKSRRKSTSSVPPSEKSDSSDLDSVHSLPIESTKDSSASQQKMKGAKANNTTLASNKNTLHAPISYADIARTNKEIADAAAAAVNNVANTAAVETSSPESKIPDSVNNNITECVIEDKPNVIITTTANAVKPQKAKKSQMKQDFPELAPTQSYSQSLSTVSTPANTTSTYPAVVLSSGTAVVNEVSPVTQTDVNVKTSPAEYYQHPAQNPQMLQKSKSVENDTSITNSSCSSSSYMAPLNSNNLDQQYPALEKTVKRHSSANVANYSTANQTSTFNFAAAAKQQISANGSEPNVNCNKNLALTTSTNTNTQTPAVTQAGINATTTNIANTSTIATTTTIINMNNNRKSKERSPPITTQNTNTTTTTIDTTNSKKSKKERQQQQQIVDGCTSQMKLNTSKKLTRTLLKSSNSLPLTATTQTNPRPAVIILNDDRNSSGCALENQFTFGDFNEDELKLFEDDTGHANTNITDPADNAPDNQDLSVVLEPQDGCGDGTLKSPVAATSYFNDSGASCENDMILVNNSTPDMLLNSSIDASSPNTSFVNSNHTNSGGAGGGGHMTSAGNNQSSDSGIYTDKTKTSSSCSGGSQNATSAVHKQISHTKEDDNKLNTFLSNTQCASVHTSMDNLDPPLPQQLETCNDIETAIIAAAREAAKHQQKAPNQTQHFTKNSNPSSNSSSFSSSSSAPYNSNSRNYNQQHGSSSSSYRQHQLNQQVQCDDANDDDDSIVNTPRSRSPSRPRRISIQFIPPTMATAFSTQQHNEIIIDFIGSAWEEIANSKVTKVYDGQ